MNKVVLLSICLIGCSTLTREQCEVGDWKAYGYLDGARGENKLAEHRESCRGVATPDEARYKEGRAEGLHFFCTPQGAYYAGVHGLSWIHECGAWNGQANQDAFRIGTEVSALKAQAKMLSESAEKAREAESKESTLVKVVQVIAGQPSHSQQLEEQRYEVENRLVLKQSSLGVPPGVEDFEHQVESTHPPRAMIAPGIGSVIGFGTGQLIQGRYRKTGWVHTTAQGASLLLLPATAGLSIFGFFASKYFEISDVWHYGMAEHYGYPHLLGRNQPAPRELMR